MSYIKDELIDFIKFWDYHADDGQNIDRLETNFFDIGKNSNLNAGNSNYRNANATGFDERMKETEGKAAAYYEFGVPESIMVMAEIIPDKISIKLQNQLWI